VYGIAVAVIALAALDAAGTDVPDDQSGPPVAAADGAAV